MDSFANLYQGKKVLITGHTGFKGAWLSTWLAMLGAEVVGISNNIVSEPNYFEHIERSDPSIKTYMIDLCDTKKAIDIITTEKPDFIFHLAAQPLVKKAQHLPFESSLNNYHANLTILEAIRLSKRDITAVLITSDKSYQNMNWEWGYRETDEIGGKDIYSGSKAAAEMAIRSYFHSYFKDSNGKKVGVARAGNVIGGGDWAEDRIVPDCIRAWSCREAVEIRHPNATRPWQHVLEPLAGYLHLGAQLYLGKVSNGIILNFGPNSRDNKTVFELINELGIHYGINTPQDMYFINEPRISIEANLLQLNCDRALAELNWEPVNDFSETVKDTADWYRNFYNKEANIDVVEFTKTQIYQFVTRAKKKNLTWMI